MRLVRANFSPVKIWRASARISTGASFRQLGARFARTTEHAGGEAQFLGCLRGESERQLN